MPIISKTNNKRWCFQEKEGILVQICYLSIQILNQFDPILYDVKPQQIYVEEILCSKKS